MKGLKEYIKKHGRHFTKELARDALKRDNILFWEPDVVMRAINRKVWYNTNSSTEGDIVYLANNFPSALSSAIGTVIAYLHDAYYGREAAFSIFESSLHLRKMDFDFTPYI